MNNWTIARRIVFGFACLLTIATAFGLFAFSRLVTIARASQRITSDCLPGVYSIGQIESLNLANFAFLHRQVLLTNAADRAALDTRMKANSDKMTTLYRDYEATITLPDDRRLFEAVLAARTNYTNVRKEFLQSLNANSTAAATTTLTTKLDPAYQAYYAAIRALVDFNKQNGDNAGGQCPSPESSARMACSPSRSHPSNGSTPSPKSSGQGKPCVTIQVRRANPHTVPSATTLGSG